MRCLSRHDTTRHYTTRASRLHPPPALSLPPTALPLPPTALPSLPLLSLPPHRSPLPPTAVPSHPTALPSPCGPPGFQAWDTAQALSSYVRGMLTSAAILRGVGVGQQVRGRAGGGVWCGVWCGGAEALGSAVGLGGATAVARAVRAAFRTSAARGPGYGCNWAGGAARGGVRQQGSNAPCALPPPPAPLPALPPPPALYASAPPTPTLHPPLISPRTSTLTPPLISLNPCPTPPPPPPPPPHTTICTGLQSAGRRVHVLFARHGRHGGGHPVRIRRGASLLGKEQGKGLAYCKCMRGLEGRRTKDGFMNCLYFSVLSGGFYGHAPRPLPPLPAPASS